VNIVFILLYAVLYNCHHPVGVLKGEEYLDWWSSHNCVRRKSSGWSLVVCLLWVFSCLYIRPTQTAIVSFVQCEMLILDMFCFI
jgi:hypothetical protein